LTICIDYYIFGIKMILIMLTMIEDANLKPWRQIVRLEEQEWGTLD